MTEFVSGSFSALRGRRLRWPLGLALMLGACVAVPRPSMAQYYYPPPMVDDDGPFMRPHRPQVLPGREIVRHLRREGFRPVSGPVLNRDVYYLDAVDPDGAPVRVIVGAFDGEIVQVFVKRGRSAVLLDPDDGAGPVDPPPMARPQTPRRAAPPPVARVPEVAPHSKQRAMPAPNPALTPANPTITKRSPLAIPKEPGEPPAAALPQGQKKTPRVIPLGPEVSAPATTPVPATPPVPQAAVPMPVQPPVPTPAVETARPLPALPELPPQPGAPRIEMKSDLPAAPPPAVLDYRNGRAPTADKPADESR